MGLIVQASLVCDKDLVNTVLLDDENSSIPDGWVRAQGYIAGIAVNGYFCPVCVSQFGLQQLFQLACTSLPGQNGK